MGIKEADLKKSDIREIMQEFLNKLVDRMDADLMRDLRSASNLKNVTSNNQLNLKIRDLERIAELGEGTIGGRPNSELRCLAYLGMLAAYERKTDYELGDENSNKNQVLADILSRALLANRTTATTFLGENVVQDLLLGMTGLDGLSPFDSINIDSMNLDGSWSNAAISPDGQRIAINDWDNMHIFDVDDPEHPIMIEEAGPADSITFTPDGLKVMTYAVFKGIVGWQTFVKLWDARSGKLVLEHRDPYGPKKREEDKRRFRGVAAGPDRNLALVDWDRLTILNADTGGVVREEKGYWFLNVAISPDGSLIATASMGGIKIADLVNGKEVQRILRSDTSQSSFSQLEFSADGATLFFSDSDVTGAYDLESGDELWRVDEKEPYVVSPDGNFFLGADLDDGVINIHDIRTGKSVGTTTERVDDDLNDARNGPHMAASANAQIFIVYGAGMIEIWRPS